MALFMRIESDQKAECSDCGRLDKIYGVQKVLSFGRCLFEDDTVLLPPLPSGWSWQPTCRRCGMQHEEEANKKPRKKGKLR
jgi:hypothetical protein